MGIVETDRSVADAAVRVENGRATAPLVIVCDHASNHLPEGFGTLGLAVEELSRHIAWDPGAADVARLMARQLGAALIESTVSRLVIDCNRPLDAPDLIPAISETTEIPANRDVATDDRQRRIELAYRPFHDAIDAIVADRLAQGRPCALVSVHSFTPVYRDVARPWHVGIVHDEDERMSRPLISALEAIPGLVVGDNQPYAPADRVYHTLEVHARERGLPCAMIEIRNDVISTGAECRLWASRFSGILAAMGFGGGEAGGRA